MRRTQIKCPALRVFCSSDFGGGHKFTYLPTSCWTEDIAARSRTWVGMHNTITVMNAKGGVGKSTLVLGLAETLATYHGKKVLVINSDAQASVSHMLLPQEQLEAVRDNGRTIVELLIGAVLSETPARWQDFVVDGASDVDDARTISLLPSDTHLTLFEREVSKRDHEVRLRELHSHMARRGQARLRHRADRQCSRPVRADGMLAARGRLFPFAHQARLYLHARAEIPPRVPAA